MIVLGFDPGYANLGISVVDTEAKEVLEGICMRAGVKTAPWKFSRNVVPVLERLRDLHGVEAIGMERPPKFPNAVATTALVWLTMGIIAGWAFHHKLPVKDISVDKHKAGVRTILGLPKTKKKPTKSQVKEAVEIYTGAKSNFVDHVDDATMAAILCYPLKR